MEPANHTVVTELLNYHLYDEALRFIIVATKLGSQERADCLSLIIEYLHKKNDVIRYSSLRGLLPEEMFIAAFDVFITHYSNNRLRGEQILYFVQICCSLERLMPRAERIMKRRRAKAKRDSLL